MAKLCFMLGEMVAESAMWARLSDRFGVRPSRRSTWAVERSKEANCCEPAPHAAQGLLGALLGVSPVVSDCRRRSIGLLGGSKIKIHP